MELAIDDVTVKNASEGWFSEWCPVHQGCRMLTFLLARLSCRVYVVFLSHCTVVV